MAENFHDQEFVEYVVKNLVEKPKDVVVTRTVDEMGVLLSLTVDKEDMGVVIGKEGRTAKALRTLLRVLGAKSDSRINLKIVDPEGEEGHREEKATEAPAETTTEANTTDEAPAIEVESSEETKEETSEAPAADEATSDVEDDDDRPMADLEI